MVEPLFDTHCHIHEADPAFDVPNMSSKKWHTAGKTNPAHILDDARKDHVTSFMCVGTTLVDSVQAVRFVANYENTWASIGIHPHEADEQLKADNWSDFASLATDPHVKAVGECGLDYFYEHSTPESQAIILRKQIELALQNDLPLIFHTREAFKDFWPIFDEYKGIRGVLHSFTDSHANLEAALERGLNIGVNGIATFAKDPAQKTMYQAIPLQNLLLETDAPYLTPAPYRGTICEPKHVRVTADFLAQLRSEPLAELAAATSRNAQTLFGV